MVTGRDANYTKAFSQANRGLDVALVEEWPHYRNFFLG